MISIRQALAEMDITYEDGLPKSFSIEYWREDGTPGKMEKATKNEKRPGSGGAAKTKFKYNVKERGVVLLFNLETNETRAVKITRINKFNGEEVFH